MCVALGNIGDSAATPALADALGSDSAIVRAHAAWALGRIGGQAARDALTAALAGETDADAVAEMRDALADMDAGG